MLRQVLQARCNLVVSGATSSGKTSLIAALLRDDRGLPPTRRGRRHRRTSASSSPCGPARGPSAEHRRPRRGRPRPTRAYRAPAAPRPDRRRRGTRRRGPGVGPGDEHRPRRVDRHLPRQRPTRRAHAARVAGAAGRPDLAAGGDPRSTRPVDRRRRPRRTIHRWAATNHGDLRGRTAVVARWGDGEPVDASTRPARWTRRTWSSSPHSRGVGDDRPATPVPARRPRARPS